MVVDVANSIKSKRRATLYCALAALLLLLLHAMARQLPSTTVTHVYDLDIDSAGIFSVAEIGSFLKILRSGKVGDMRDSKMGSWGVRKGLNHLATLSNGESVFMKERGNKFQMQGELYSYYLNCFLEMWNVPPTALACVNTTNHQWIDNLTKPMMSGHSYTCYIATAYVSGLKDVVYMPERGRQGIGLEAISTTPRELSHLMEWSDMILFDFLCGQSDRLVDNLFFPRVNFEIPLKKVPNLMKTSSGELVLIDHEATFHISYSKARVNAAERYKQSHYLKMVSVFRRRTVERVCWLCSHKDPASTLEAYINDHDPLSLLIATKLIQEDRYDFKKRLLNVCNQTCHVLSSSTRTTSTIYMV